MKIKLFFLVYILTTQAHGMQNFIARACNTFTTIKNVIPRSNYNLNQNFATKIKALSTIIVGGVIVGGVIFDQNSDNNKITINNKEDNNKEDGSSTVTVANDGGRTIIAQNNEVKITCQRPNLPNNTGLEKRIIPNAECEILSKMLNMWANFNNDSNNIFAALEQNKNIKELYTLVPNATEKKDTASQNSNCGRTIVAQNQDVVVIGKGSRLTEQINRENKDARISCTRVIQDGQQKTSCEVVCKALNCMNILTDPNAVFDHLKTKQDITGLYNNPKC